MSYDIDHPNWPQIEATLRERDLAAEADAIFGELKALRDVRDGQPDMLLAILWTWDELRATPLGDQDFGPKQSCDVAVVAALEHLRCAFVDNPRVDSLNREFVRLRAIEHAARTLVEQCEAGGYLTSHPAQRRALANALAVAPVKTDLVMT